METKPQKNQYKIYPKYSLKEAVDFTIQVVYEIAGEKGVAHLDDILKKMDLSSERSGRYTYKKSSAQQFGLIKWRDVGLQMTEFGLKFKSSNVSMEEKFRAIMNSQLFKDIILVLDGKKLPNDNSLKSTFRDYGLTSIEAQKSIVKSFKESIKYVGLLKPDNTIKIPKNLLKSIDINKDRELEDLTSPLEDIKKGSKTSSLSSQTLESNHEIKIPLFKGKNAVVKFSLALPISIETEEKENLKEIIMEKVINIINNM